MLSSRKPVQCHDTRWVARSNTGDQPLLFESAYGIPPPIGFSIKQLHQKYLKSLKPFLMKRGLIRGIAGIKCQLLCYPDFMRIDCPVHTPSVNSCVRIAGEGKW